MQVNFGGEAKKWLDKQLSQINSGVVSNWQSALVSQADKMETLLKSWDSDGDGKISRREFRRGIKKLGVGAPEREARAIAQPETSASSH